MRRVRYAHAGLISLSIFAAMSPVIGLGQDVATVTQLNAPAGTSGALLSGYQIARGGQVVGWASVSGVGFHATLWDHSGTGIDLNPQNITTSQAFATDGSHQVGQGSGTATANQTHALLWSNSATGVIDLHPSGYTGSAAYGVYGNQQVGIAYTASTIQAVVWNGSSQSAGALPMTGVTNSHAYATDGTHQVGDATINSKVHAILWTGSGQNGFDLDAGTFTTTRAYGVRDGKEVGYGATAGVQHALLWIGATTSAIDLNPTNFSGSFASDVSGNTEVGSGTAANGEMHALLWQGSKASAIDLQQFLPSYITSSGADAIIGDTVYGYASDADYNNYAVQWSLSAIPEPTSLATLAVAGLLLKRRGRAA